MASCDWFTFVDTITYRVCNWSEQLLTHFVWLLMIKCYIGYEIWTGARNNAPRDHFRDEIDPGDDGNSCSDATNVSSVAGALLYNSKLGTLHQIRMGLSLVQYRSVTVLVYSFLLFLNGNL